MQRFMIGLLVVAVACSKSAPATTWKVGGADVSDRIVPMKPQLPAVLGGKLGQVAPPDLGDAIDKATIPHVLGFDVMSAADDKEGKLTGFRIYFHKADPTADLVAKWGPPAKQQGSSYSCWKLPDELWACVVPADDSSFWMLQYGKQSTFRFWSDLQAP